MKKIGRYEIIEELGRGAMGIVYKASDPTIGRLVAIKVLSLAEPTERDVPGVRDMFMREARAAGRLSHPGIVTIHDALEDLETRRSYIVMEFIPGRTLENVLTSKFCLETEETLGIARQIAEALDYAHRHQIIHRDLKPANILLTDDGRVKITDFGIAKIVAREGAARTVAIMGTPAYMSPEQVTGGEVDARSDLFSLGILLYLMLTGQKPFPGETAAVMFKIVYEDPVAPSQLNPQLSPGYDYLVSRCLVKDRNKRYSSAREFLDDLGDIRIGRPARSGEQFPLSELHVGERTLVARKPPLAPQDAESKEQRKKRRVLVAVLGGLFVALLGGGIWTVHHRSAFSPPAATVKPEPVPATTAESTPASVVPAQPARPADKPKPTVTKKVEPAPVPATTPERSSGVPPSSPAPPPQARLATSAKPTTAEQIVKVLCRHGIRDGTLTVSGPAGVILQTKLKGWKRGGFLGIRGGFAGLVADTMRVPAGTRELTVHVYSKDGTVDFTRAVPASAPTDTLEVLVDREGLRLSWQASSDSNR